MAVQSITWVEAIKGFLVALPELVALIKPSATLINKIFKENPGKNAAEMGDILRDFFDSMLEEDLVEQKRKKRASLKKMVGFLSHD